MESAKLALKFEEATFNQRYRDYRGAEYLAAIGDIISMSSLIARDYKIAREALEKACYDSDYCYVCNMHPITDGHSKECILAN